MLFHRQSPKAVLGNRFITVELSETNLVETDASYVDPAEAAAVRDAAAKAEAAASLAARKKAHEKLIVSEVARPGYTLRSVLPRLPTITPKARCSQHLLCGCLLAF